MYLSSIDTQSDLFSGVISHVVFSGCFECHMAVEDGQMLLKRKHISEGEDGENENY
jgi:hypothetical protein